MDFNRRILKVLEARGKLSKQDILALARREFPELTDAAVSWRLHDMKSQGLIQSCGYGNYTLSEKHAFLPVVSARLKRLYHKIHREFPFIEACVWDSRWFNNFMQHQLFRFYLVIEVEKGAAESVFNALTDFNTNVFLDPDKNVFDRYVSNFDEVIIVKPLISEAPLIEHDGIKLASLEKLLIDVLADKVLFAAQQQELGYIYQSVQQKYNLNVSRMRRYARRRNQSDRLNTLLHK
ncbi:MAG: hypothetical protein IBJ09_07875 [Bacteroidia bacterium]|nr:hypothetical protein [Bacteroidia bacterium]